MNPKEKAQELCDKFLSTQSNTEEIYDAKQCALIAVDEILKLKVLLDDDFSDLVKDTFYNHTVSYWNDVKQEISSL